MGEVLLGVGVCQSQSSLIVVRPKVGFRSLRKTHNNSVSRSTLRCSTPTQLSKSPSSCGFGGVRLDLQRHCVLASGAVSSDPLQASTVFTVDSIQPDFGGGGDGGGFGDKGGGGGGGGGDGDNNSKGDDEGEEQNSKKMGSMSMSQKLTLGYAALVGVGGVMGYLKSGSQKSLLAGGISASLLYYVYSQLPVRPVLASSVGLGISAALLGVMGARFKKSGKIFPAGVVSLVSLIMTGGYLHGIMRSLH
ncbi:protein FATTY ACID EXPORT 2, chloroplastic-like [Quercus lobata]|uniref:protein FATTY ACID EXPORT 2, chloroplastic-like n=1 Tax=Quercus lobata TaxID=97700 RepID=UPI001248FEAC|nr:protein FATTY ACID EXPORT 2, chloroplastic-like [Quercus lobata]